VTSPSSSKKLGPAKARSCGRASGEGGIEGALPEERRQRELLEQRRHLGEIGVVLDARVTEEPHGVRRRLDLLRARRDGALKPGPVIT